VWLVFYEEGIGETRQVTVLGVVDILSHSENKRVVKGIQLVVSKFLYVLDAIAIEIDDFLTVPSFRLR